MPNHKGITEAGRDIYTVNFADYLPAALKHDSKMRAIAEAVTKEALAVSGEIENVLIYSRIDDLPEALLDILAYDMHVDWYDYSYPLKVKRDILKGSVRVHKKMGTKYAVEKALGALYPQSKVEEWFEYDGQPYYFKIKVDISDMGMTGETTRQIEEKVRFYKNLRSHCECIIYKMNCKKATVRVGALHKIGETLKIKPFLQSSIKSTVIERIVVAPIKTLNSIQIEGK